MSAAAFPADLQETLRLLRERSADARERYGVEFVGIVGSLARGDARSDSDVDVVVRNTGATLFGLARLEAELKAAIGRNVDLVFSEGMRAKSRGFIERDLVLL